MKKLMLALLIAAILISGTILTSSAAFAETDALPSDTWLAEVDSEILTALTALANDDDFFAAIGIPEVAKHHLLPAAEYSSEPIAVMYPPEDLSLLFEQLASTPEENAIMNADPDLFYDTYIHETLYSMLSTEELAMSYSLQLSHRMPIEGDIVTTYALYMPSDGTESCGVLIGHSSQNGVLSILTRFLPYSICAGFTDVNSGVSFAFEYSGVSILTEGDEFPTGSPVTGDAAAVQYATADEAWIAERSLELAEEVLGYVADPSYVSMFTEDPELLEACAEIGKHTVTIEDVSEPVPFTTDIMTMMGIDKNAASAEYIEKYFSAEAARLYIQSTVNSFGMNTLIMSSLSSANGVYCANADFAACIVTVATGGSHDVIIAFANHGNGVIDANARLIPVE